jgi:hypothetical protein
MDTSPVDDPSSIGAHQQRTTTTSIFNDFVALANPKNCHSRAFCPELHSKAAW